MLDLQDAYLSVAAAERRTREFLADWDATLQMVSGEKVVQLNENGLSEHWVEYGSITSPHLATTLAEIILHLRRSLDQVCAAFWRANSDIEPPRNLYFPICSSEPDLRGRLGAPPLNNLGPHFAKVVSSYAPYPAKAEKDEGVHLFVGLNAAAKESHRIVCKVRGQVTSLRISNGLLTGLVSAIGEHRWDMETNALLIATTTPDGVVQANINVDLTPVFGGVPILEGAPIAPNIIAMAGLCTRLLDDLSA